MHHFHRKNGQLHIEKLPVADLVKHYQTPLYLYSQSTLEDHWLKLDRALASVDHLICFAMKANSNLAVLNCLAKLGSGFDIVSGGELYRVKKAGGDPQKCNFAGVGKTREEIEFALQENIYSFNVESEAELNFINEIAGKLKKRAPIAVRVNPNIKADTHSKITTGTYENKFGIAFEEIPALYHRISQLPHLKIRGLQTHIGSQITDVKPFLQAIEKLVPLINELKEKYALEFFDIGGGMGIVYDPALESGAESWWQTHPNLLTPERYTQAILPLLKKLNLKILLEPGRYIAGNAGILVTEVLFVKNTGEKRFVIVDAAMNDLVRPAFYDSYHEIVPLDNLETSPTLVPTDIVGPICESSDVFCKDRPLPELKQGDHIALLSAGAYGFTMASNYNSRPRPAEILVKDSNHRLIRKRETLDDLIRGEVI
jgi:diaminopimelate decarboxylase